MLFRLSGDDVGQRRKNRKFNFEDCRVVDELQVPESLVQIKVDEDEIQRRIQAFIELKREKINQKNLEDFIESKDPESCARVVSKVRRLKNPQGHLRIKRVKNLTGPNDLVIRSESTSAKLDKNFDSINERLEDVELYLKLATTAIPKDVYVRLKMIEDQIAFLKTASPEYAQFIRIRNSARWKKVEYSISDLDKIIASMEEVVS